MLIRSTVLASALTLGFALLGGCSAADDDTPAAVTPPDDDAGTTSPTTEAAAPVTPAQACTTLPRSKLTKPTEYFRVFASDQAAFDLYSKSAKYIAPGSDMQKRGEAATLKMYEAIKTLYPEAVDGMTTPPRVLIADDDDFNAGASRGRTPAGVPYAYWVFSFNKGMFKPEVTDAQLESVTAHELAHLVLRNGVDEFAPDIWYRETEKDDIFGEYQTNDVALQKLGDAILKIGGRTGQLFNTELNGFPTSIGAKTATGKDAALYVRYLNTLFKQLAPASTQKAQCTASSATVVEIYNIFKKRLNYDTNELVLSDDATKLDALTKQYQTQLAACFSNANVTWIQLATFQRQLEDPDAKAEIAKLQGDRTKLAVYLNLIKAENDADLANPTQNIASKLFQISTGLQDIVRTELAKPELKASEIRVFTQEDDADEVAVRAAKLVGIPATDVTGSLLVHTQTAEYRAACEAKIAKDEMPAYGGFADPHHSTCWRHYRNLKLDTALKTCSASWPK